LWGPQAGHPVEINVSRQILERPEHRGVQGRIGRADAGRQRMDEAVRSGDGWRLSALLDKFASRAEAGCGYFDPPAEAPAKDWPMCQVSEANIGLALENLEQSVDVTGDDIPAVTQIPPLIPSEECVQRRRRWEGARVEARRQWSGRLRHRNMIATNLSKNAFDRACRSSKRDDADRSFAAIVD
jgi:hypothetical protein